MMQRAKAGTAQPDTQSLDYSVYLLCLPSWCYCFPVVLTPLTDPAVIANAIEMADDLPHYQLSNCILCNPHSMQWGRFCCALSSYRSYCRGRSFISVLSSARTQAIKVILGNLTQCLQFFSLQVKLCGDDTPIPYSKLHQITDQRLSAGGFT